MREAHYKSIGLQLKKIRDQLDWTMEIMSKATGISRSYLSDFGKHNEEIDELLVFLASVPHAIYAFLAFFAEYKINNKQLIKQYLHDKEKEGPENQLYK
jgi:transcriptional regulator with XRE-family HTH domain